MTSLQSAMFPTARGPLSAAVSETLSAPPPGQLLPLDAIADADPFGDDLQLGPHLCYELHYQGLPGVDAGWE